MFCKLLSRSGGVGSSTDRRAIDERHAAVRVNGAINRRRWWTRGGRKRGAGFTVEARHVRGGRGITCAAAAPHEPAIYRDLFRRDNRERTVPRIQYRSARNPQHWAGGKGKGRGQKLARNGSRQTVACRPAVLSYLFTVGETRS